jgi:hypothetical protein
VPVDLPTLYALALYGLVLVLPGLAVLRLLGVRPADGGVWLGLAAGLGLALQPLIYLWAATFGLRVGPAFWWAVLLASAVIVALGALRRPRARPAWAHPQPAHWALAAVLVVALGARWWAARELTVPLWGDSFQHSVMVRLFLEQGGLPANWRPYAELATFTYHFGLHGSVATLAWLSGLPAEGALLVAGQGLMVLQVLTLYALAAGLSGRPWAGVGAALAAAGLGPMPGYYLNWGRYTQLAGQVALPAAALAAAWVPRAWRGNRAGAARAVLLAGLAVAGLALTHYLVTVFFAAWAAAWVLVGAADTGLAWRAAARRALALVPVAGMAWLLTLPWLPRFLGGVLDDVAARLVTTRVANPDVFGIVTPQSLWGSAAAVDHHVGLVLAAVAVVAAGYGLVRRARLTALGLVWLALMLLAAYPGALGLPVSGVVKDFTVAIALYLPLGLVIGGGLGAALDPSAIPWPGAEVAVAVAIAAGAVVLAGTQRDVVDRQFMLVTPADEAALRWIRAHTPPEAVFLVGSFDAFGGTVQAGDDAGWWLPVLAGRRTTVPPITVGLERPYDPDYRDRLNRLAAACRADLDGAACQRSLDAFGVTYAYTGPTGRALPRPALAASKHWRAVFDAGGAQVYERVP